jgi:hypothetical protein
VKPVACGARILGLVNVSQAAQSLEEDEKGICDVDTLGGEQEVLIVSETRFEVRSIGAIHKRRSSAIAKIAIPWDSNAAGLADAV